MKLSALLTALVLLFGFSSTSLANNVSQAAQTAAEHALKTYYQDTVKALAKLVSHNTVATEGLSANDNPAHIAFKQDLAKLAAQLGFDYADHGYVVVIGMGKQTQRVGIITHGDIQPVDASKWTQSPFKLDSESQPGKLIGRGTEDDKGPIVTALYAMKAIQDSKLSLSKRIELYVYMAEESDWQPLEQYIANNTLPSINITLDAEYPVVTAEKGYGTIKLQFEESAIASSQTAIHQFSGGFFGSQIPEDAQAVIAPADAQLLQKLMTRAKKLSNMQFDFNLKGEQLTITARGISAHSSKPEDGVNAITHLAQLLAYQSWPHTAAGALVNFINDMIGLDLYGNQFGKIAYRDDFMGPMTVSPTVIKTKQDALELNINIRRPVGKSAEQLKVEIGAAISQWKKATGHQVTELDHYIGNPFVQRDAPHVPTLLSVFRHYTGQQDAQPIAIGGGTNSRLFPNAVAFGPSMPGVIYSGHSEHEFISVEQLKLNLKMYTAVLVELAK